MSNEKVIVIIDYGLGNLFSLLKALKCFTHSVVITDNPEMIGSAAAVVLPGVGAFAVGMEGLKNKNLIEPLRKFADGGRPMLGICLGAQLLLNKGFEFGEHEGLGIISGAVTIFPNTVKEREKIPQIGWNELYAPENITWEKTIFSGINDHPIVYFVHSYIMIPDNKSDCLAMAEYGSLEFCAAIRKGNVFGTQFHPEKSGEVGIEIIKNFISLIP